jgi:hypothetical protein
MLHIFLASQTYLLNLIYNIVKYINFYNIKLILSNQVDYGYTNIEILAPLKCKKFAWLSIK